VARLRVSAKADRDLIGIWKYIAAENESAADRFFDLLHEKFRALAAAPGIGAGQTTSSGARGSFRSENTSSTTSFRCT